MAVNTEQRSIPDDITIQIFSWLPVTSLMRYRCVSKFYNTIVLEPNFVDLHSSNYCKINRGDTKLITCINGVCYSIEKHDEDGKATKFYQIENFSKLYNHINISYNYRLYFDYDNGLFCIWDMQNIAISNPSTGEVRCLPYLKCFDVSGEKFICSIGFEPEDKKYKVVLTINSQGGLSRAWVFTLGIDTSWREMIKYNEFVYDISPCSFGICISGIIYRFSQSPDFIVVFDVKSENFTSITTSIEFSNGLHESGYYEDYMLIDANGKLGILKFPPFRRTEYIHLWIFKEEWEHQLFQFPLEWKHEDIYLSTKKICKYGGEEIVFAINMTSSDVFVYFFYHVKNKSWRYLEVQEFPYWVENIFTYSETLFPLKNIGLPTII
uniref:F-box protein n=1 Tax=Solanum tuberosum TaxID=4113 RepID=M1DGX6_SOLTU